MIIRVASVIQKLCDVVDILVASLESVGASDIVDADEEGFLSHGHFRVRDWRYKDHCRRLISGLNSMVGVEREMLSMLAGLRV